MANGNNSAVSVLAGNVSFYNDFQQGDSYQTEEFEISGRVKTNVKECDDDS